MASFAPTRVLFAAEDLLRGYLDTTEFEVVGEAARGSALRALLAALEPDVLLLDEGLVGGDAPTAIDELHRSFPDVGIVVLSAREDAEAIRTALESGARAYLVKGRDPRRLAPALRQALVAAGAGSGLRCPQCGANLVRPLPPAA